VNPIWRQLPNLLTAARLAAAPALAFLLLWDSFGAALAVFAFAGISDAADGFLAKRYGLATQFGRFLDPAADKLLMLAAFLTLSTLHVAPLWLTLLVIGRDVAIVLGVFLAMFLEMPLKFEPLQIGKLSTVVQVGYVSLVLIVLALGLDWPDTMAMAAVTTAIVTLASGLAYGQYWFRALARRRSRPA
jgi:cardiolipin synthase